MKNIFWLLPLAALLVLTACGSDSSSTPEYKVIETEKEEPLGCNFSKTDNVWKYTYPDYDLTEIYTWIDETTVKFEEYMNSYHLDQNDATYTNVNRDVFFEEKMADCRYFVLGERNP